MLDRIKLINGAEHVSQRVVDISKEDDIYNRISRLRQVLETELGVAANWKKQLESLEQSNYSNLDDLRLALVARDDDFVSKLIALRTKLDTMWEAVDLASALSRNIEKFYGSAIEVRSDKVLQSWLGDRFEWSHLRTVSEKEWSALPEVQQKRLTFAVHYQSKWLVESAMLLIPYTDIDLETKRSYLDQTLALIENGDLPYILGAYSRNKADLLNFA